MPDPAMPDPAPDDWKALRRAQRADLLEARNALPLSNRLGMARQVIANLDKAVADLPCRVLGLYWPIKREIDLLKWAASLSETRGIALALPVVSIPRSPLEYWLWQPGARMTRGFWNIPVPVEKKPIDPDVVIAPLVGFHDCWRLGYGGGYFDRTLAARTPRPAAIGIGFDFTEVSHFTPRDHDIPMKRIVTESRIYERKA